MTGITQTSRALTSLLISSFLCAQARAQMNGDYDGDSDIDGADFIEFTACMTGPIGDPPGAGCEAFDYDIGSGADGYIDMADFFELQREVAGNGPCDGETRVVRLTNSDHATGCSASITTHQTKLCGQDIGAIDPAGSFAWAGVTERINSPIENPRLNWRWAQTGYVYRRNLQGGNAVQPSLNRYVEIKVAGTAVPGIFEPGPAPSIPGPHNYKIYLVAPLFVGIWHADFDDDNAWFMGPPLNDWVGNTGKPEWAGEIKNSLDDMVGVVDDKCSFTMCRFALNGGDFDWTPTISQLIIDQGSSDKKRWKGDPGPTDVQPVPDDDFRIWDLKPNP